MGRSFVKKRRSVLGGDNRLRLAAVPAAFILWLLGSAWGWSATVKDVRKKMGSRFEVTAVHEDPGRAQQAIDAAYAEIDRLEAMISSWRDSSQTSAINANAGVAPVGVSQELFNLIRRSLRVSELTEGAFDITFAGVGKLWDFDSDPPALPDPEAVRQAIARIDYRDVVLDPENHTVFLKRTGMRIGFGAIGKGYAANRAVFVLKGMGIESGVVNAGGDLVAFGAQESGEPWQIGIAHPRDRDHVFLRLKLSEQAVVTSGDYERFMIVDGKRYCHILDPKTGFPADSLQSVTIICPDAELADALATSVFVMGPEKGMALIERLKNVECVLVDAQGELHYSHNVKTQMLDVEERL